MEKKKVIYEVRNELCCWDGETKVYYVGKPDVRSSGSENVILRGREHFRRNNR